MDGEWKAGEGESRRVGDGEGWKGNVEAWRGRGRKVRKENGRLGEGRDWRMRKEARWTR